MKALFNDNISPQTGDVIVNPGNPENPDSNNWLPRALFHPRMGAYYQRAGTISRWYSPFQGLLALQPIFYSL